MTFKVAGLSMNLNCSTGEASIVAPLANRYMPQLDTLRALAIACVLIEHLGGPVARRWFPLDAGAIGVDLFFVLSGFLISGILFAELDRATSVALVIVRFFFRRAVRLLPAYYLVIAALYAFNIEQVREQWPWHVAYASNFLVLHGGRFLSFWSLAVEEQFYLFLPCIALLVPPRHRAVAAVGLVVTGFICRCLALPAGLPPDDFEVLLLGKFEVLGFGVLLGALSYRNGDRAFEWLDGSLGRCFTVIAIVALLFELAVWWLTPMHGLWRYYSFTIAAALFLGWAVVHAARGFTGRLGWAFDHWLPRAMGRISYTIYLVHPFLPLILQKPAVEAMTGHLPLPVLALASLLLSIAIAALCWVCLERPLMRAAQQWMANDRPAHQSSDQSCRSAPQVAGRDAAHTSPAGPCRAPQAAWCRPPVADQIDPVCPLPAPLQGRADRAAQAFDDSGDGLGRH